MLGRSLSFAKAMALRWPVIVQAPMAGGITTPQLVAAVAKNGGLGSFATGYLKNNEILKGLTEIRALTDKPFSANVFVPTLNRSTNKCDTEAYIQIINKFRTKVGLPDIDSQHSMQFLEEKIGDTIDILIEQKVKAVSFTFGIPSEELICKLKKNGVYLFATANSLEEARLIEHAGFDAIVVQGYEAGGHRGGFLTKVEYSEIGLFSLVPQISEAVKCPVIACGGIMDGRGVLASLILGASAVQLGTAFLAVKESGASKKYKDELEIARTRDFDVTTLTNAYTGKFARGIRTEFSDEIEANVKRIPEYPVAHGLSTQLRKRASEINYRDAMSMWCGQSVYKIRTDLETSKLIERIRDEFYSCLSELEFKKKEPLNKNLFENVKNRRDIMFSGEKIIHIGDVGSDEDIEVNQPTEEETTLLSNEDNSKRLEKLKHTSMLLLAAFNGALYFTIAEAGGGNIERLFHADGQAMDNVIIGISAGASVVYTMFMYKTLESLTLQIDTPIKKLFFSLAPFSAVAFLTGGLEGSELIGIPGIPAIIIGMTLFSLRMINSFDASSKFQHRFLETKMAWNESIKKGDYAEIARLITVGFVTLGYSVSTTDAIYSAVFSIMSWLGATASISSPISYTCSALGAVGTLPLIFYWGHRGLRQLTFGGRPDHNGINHDPTDIYTYVGLVLASPIILGILGGATASGGAVFGQLGLFAEIIRVSTSVMYGAFASTPGMATFIRYIFNQIQKICSVEERSEFDQNIQIAANMTSDFPKSQGNSWCNFFSGFSLFNTRDKQKGNENDKPSSNRSSLK